MPQPDSTDCKHHEAHSGFYLTLVSIMQGLALGYLLQVLTVELTTTGALSLLSLLQFLASLALLIIVWHEYAIGTVLFRWRLDMADSAIPFLFGICEYVLIAAIGIPSAGHILSAARFSIYLWSLPAFCIVSCLAYWNQYAKAVVDNESRDMVLVSKRNWLQALLTTVCFAIIATCHQVWHFGRVGQIVLAAVVAVALVGHAIRINKAYERRI